MKKHNTGALTPSSKETEFRKSPIALACALALFAGAAVAQQTPEPAKTEAAKKDDAKAALNILFRGRVYALALTTDGEADRAVVFQDEPLTGGGPRKLPADALRALIERARQRDRATFALPGMDVMTDRAEPTIITAYRNFTATIEAVTRFEAEDALVFRIKLENALGIAVPYDPQGLAIRLDREFFPAALADASGAIPPHGVSLAYFVISGGPHGRANLTVREKFSVIVPRP
mgnify:CR=1 FL=1